MHRFFLKPEVITGYSVTFPETLAHQIMNVLRLGEGDQVAVLDNHGNVHQVTLVVDRMARTVKGNITATSRITTEPDCQISLFFGLTNREKVDWVLQKCTEVGVSEFYPFLSSRTLVQSASLAAKKIDRWERIIREAAEQSGRGRLPELHQPQMLSRCLSDMSEGFHLCILAWEGASVEGESLHEILQNFAGDSIALFVGPEGGFSEDEVKLAVDAGCRIVSLGPRVLRTETAAVVFPALVLYDLGLQKN